MTLRLRNLLGVLAFACLGLACTPTYNWRTVELQSLSLLLPCKPDKAARDVILAQQPLTMHMVGCESGEALFALSHVSVDTLTDIPAVLAAWQAETLRNLHSTPTAESASQGWKELNNGLAASHAMGVDGRTADGKPVQARLAWFVRGHDIYHLAVYAPHIQLEMLEPMVSDIKWR